MNPVFWIPCLIWAGATGSDHLSRWATDGLDRSVRVAAWLDSLGDDSGPRSIARRTAANAPRDGALHRSVADQAAGKLSNPESGPHSLSRKPVPIRRASSVLANTGTGDSNRDGAPAKVAEGERARNHRIAECLAIYYTKPVDADKLRPWSILHGLIAYGPKAQVMTAGKPEEAVRYLCNNGAGNGMRLLGLQNGKLVTRIGQGVQGHPGQFLAILAQCNVPIDQPLTVDGRQFRLRDLVEYEQKTCRSGTELTFKLIALAHYLEPNAVWTNELGEKWDMQRLIREELAQPVIEGACGGTHRLMSWTYAVRQLERLGLPPSGEWHNAARMLGVYEEHAWKLQNPDGSFSTEFFIGPGSDPDPTRRLYSTGHILEWLVCTLPEERMSDPRLAKAVDYLTQLMLSAPRYELDVGPRGHALHALAVYERRCFGESSDYAQLLKAGMPYYPTEKALTAKSSSAVPATQASGSNRSEFPNATRPGTRIFRRR